MLVQAQVEARMSRAVRQHSEWLEEHERIWLRIDTALAEATLKLNLIARMRGEGGPEGRSQIS